MAHVEICLFVRESKLFLNFETFFKDLLTPGIENGDENNGRKKKRKNNKFSIKFKKLEKKLLAVAGASITFSSQDRFFPVTKR